jgi:hypothetical protein
MDEFAAWVLTPLVLALASWGVGLLLERAAATRLEGGLVLPVGFAGSIVLLTLPFTVGLGAPFAFVLLVVAAAAGAFLARDHLRASLPQLPLALAAVAAFLLYIAPVLMTGEATFAGYGFLGDNAVHFSLVDHVVDHGSRMTDIPATSYGEVLSRNLSGYPLGPHFQAAVLTWLFGTDVAWLWQGYIAFAIALAVFPGAWLLRSLGLGPWASAAGGFAAVAAYLPFSYALQGGAKELVMVLFVLLGAVFAAELADGRTTLRRAALFGVAAAGAFGVYSTGGLPWFLAMGGLAVTAALVFARHRAGAVLIAAAGTAVVFGVLAAPSIARAVSFYAPAKRLLESSAGADVGNLIAKLPFWEAFGVWLVDDFRLQPAGGDLTLTYGLVGVVAVLVALGGLYALRRRAFGIPIFVVASFAVWVLVPAGIYIEAKLLVILAPALVLTAVAGCAALAARGLRIEGLLAAAVLAGAIIVSDAFAYHGLYLAPKDRLAELQAIGERYAGRGPTMLDEFEEYGKHFLRDADVYAPFDGYVGGKAPEFRTPGPSYASWRDVDDMTLGYLQQFNLIVRRRSPANSRPPASYRGVHTGRYYEVWEDTGRARAREHLSLGTPEDPAGRPRCRDVRALANRAGDGALLVAATRPKPLLLPAYQMARPPHWGMDPNTHRLGASGPGELITSFTAPADRYRVWVGGTFGRGADVIVDGRRVGHAEDIQPPGQYSLAGETELRDGKHRLIVRRGGGNLLPGNGRDEGYDAVVLDPMSEPDLERFPTSDAESLCRRRLDWIEAVSP